MFRVRYDHPDVFLLYRNESLNMAFLLDTFIESVYYLVVEPGMIINIVVLIMSV